MVSRNFSSPDRDPTMVLSIFDERSGQPADLRVDRVLVIGRPNTVSRASLIGALGLIDPSGDEVSLPCGLKLDRNNHVVAFGETEIPNQPTKTEFSILDILVSDPVHLHLRQDILAGVWGAASDYYDKRLVDVHVSNLKHKLGANNGNNKYPPGPNQGLIKAVRSFGFMMGKRAFESEPLVMPTE